MTLAAQSTTAFWWPFKPQRFTGNALLEAGALGIDPDMRVIAFGDFNGDQFVDVVALGSDQKLLAIFTWSHAEFRFTQSALFRHPYSVQNVIPGDFTQDGKLDLLVVGSGETSNELSVSLYIAKYEGGFDMNPVVAPPSALVQPVAVDANGDMKIDLLGLTPNSDNLKVWQNTWNASRPNRGVFEVTDLRMDDASCKLANPHSNAFVDLDGDCLADLFLVCDDGNGKKRFQIWTNDKTSGFHLRQSEQLPAGTQAISFADVDRDGTVDMIFSTCASVSSKTGIGSSCSINIAYNKQIPLCESATTPSMVNGRRVCRPLESLCLRDPLFKFDLRGDDSNEAFVSIPLSSLVPSADGKSPGLLVMDTTSSPPLPVPITLGDSDLDGFPDLLLIVAHDDRTTPKLLFNTPCGPSVVGCGGDRKRGWKVGKKGIEVLDKVHDARGVAMVDMDEDGTLDIMVQRTGKQGQGKISFLQNNFYYDAFFLKAIVLNGACENGWCASPNGSTKFHPYGVSYSGATFKYSVIDTSGKRAAAQVAQMPQTGYQALQTPYTFFGLGRTNNYLESLFVGSTKHSQEHFIAMEGVIPNSRVVVIPATHDGASWRRELYLRPGKWIPWVTFTVALATAMLAGIVGLLHLAEKRADERERRKASHRINFDAL